MTLCPLQLGPLVKARFVRRPNRFLVHCDVPGQGTIEAFLPNPGRLWELLLPDVTLYVTASGPAPDGPRTRKTKHTVLAVERGRRPVFLHTHMTNRVARVLIDLGRIPGLEDAEIVRAEVPVGASRFDFLLRRGRSDVLLEVKSCTLFGNRVAMFPDAVTDRGRRHLEELAALSRRGRRPAVLFLVHTPHARWFMPDYHTDLAFSQTLLDVRRKVDVLPVSISWNADLTLSDRVGPLVIPWDYVRREAQDRGAYLLLVRLARDRRLEIGRLGTFRFPRGWYVYVGSAMRNLAARLARHTRRRKRLHWHVDHLRQAAAEVIPLPIRSSRRDECPLAQAMAEIYPPAAAGFGSSDCTCPTHLFRAGASPLEQAPFHAVLQQFRMRAPVG